MNFHEIFSQPFTQVTLPILIGFFIAVFSQNKRLDDLRNDFNRRFDETNGGFNRRFEETNASFNRRFEETNASFNRRFDDVISRLDRIETKLDDHDRRITRVEERTSPLRA